MEKADVHLATLAAEELERLVLQFGVAPLDRLPEKLCGGYSSVNYAVVAEHGRTRALLRVVVGLSDEDAERQSRVLRAVAGMGVQCPRTRMTPAGSYVVPCTTSAGARACAAMHEWVDGETANKLAPGDEAGMLGHLGRLLAQLHSAPQPEEGLGLHDVSSDSYLQCFMHWPSGTALQGGLAETAEVAGVSHPIVEFLRSHCEGHLRALAERGLPRGLLHGDPFLDNMMVGAAGATLLDWDEAAVGPFVYDLACAVVGGCFREDGDLNEPRLRSLLGAYSKVRPLSELELSAVPALMQANALLVAWYRWRAFHVEVADAPADAKESYREMLRIHETLERGPTRDAVAAALAALSGG